LRIDKTELTNAEQQDEPFVQVYPFPGSPLTLFPQVLSGLSCRFPRSTRARNPRVEERDSSASFLVGIDLMEPVGLAFAGRIAPTAARARRRE